MKAISAREAKYNFGRMIDTARAEPVIVEKHGRPVVVVLAVEKYENWVSTSLSYPLHLVSEAAMTAD